MRFRHSNAELGTLVVRAVTGAGVHLGLIEVDEQQAGSYRAEHRGKGVAVEVPTSSYPRGSTGAVVHVTRTDTLIHKCGKINTTSYSKNFHPTGGSLDSPAHETANFRSPVNFAFHLVCR